MKTSVSFDTLVFVSSLLHSFDPFLLRCLPHHGDSSLFLAERSVAVAETGNPYIGALRQCSAVEGSIPGVVDVVGGEDLTSATVVDDHLEVGDGSGRLYLKDTVVGVVGGREDDVGCP